MVVKFGNDDCVYFGIALDDLSLSDDSFYNDTSEKYSFYGIYPLNNGRSCNI